MNEIIRLENVVKMYDGNHRAVSGVSLCIQEEERIEICGPRGSGKRTLMQLIAGIETPSAGKVFVMDQAVHNMKVEKAAALRNRCMGIIGRQGFINRLSVLDNVSLPLAVQGMTKQQRTQKAKKLLQNLGILHIAHAYPLQISAYQALIASAARAMVVQPKILMLYEAAAYRLSKRETEEFNGTINAISEYGDYTILSFSVEPNNDLITNRRIMLRYGKITEEKSCKE